MDLADSAIPEPSRHGRDADATKQALVHAARRHFATHGYRASKVREIAADAGVNVALINRYFRSKEGLFEACMIRVSDELIGVDFRRDVDELIQSLIARVAHSPNGDDPLQLLLLLRSSGDDDADQIRRRTLERFTEKLASEVGWSSDDSTTAPLMLRAQIAISTLMGAVMIRTSTRAEPLHSATAHDLDEPLSAALRALLTPVQ